MKHKNKSEIRNPKSEIFLSSEFRIFSCFEFRASNFCKSSGFTILYAVLVASVLLSIGLSTYNISSKQYLLSSSSVDSQVSIYMADTGVECALYWDGKEAFATSTQQGTNITCNGVTYSPSESRPTGKVISTFTISDGVQCAVVAVTKSNETGPPAYVKTTIESRGYNYCASNPRKVERALQVIYPLLP